MAAPKQTGGGDQEMIAPQPTTTARAEVASEPGLGAVELVKRYPGYTMEADTCGFIGASSSAPITCVRNSATCTNNGAFIGCCTTQGTACFSSVKTACIPFSESRTRCTTVSDARSICCSSEYPECYTYTFTASSVSPISILTALNCDTKTGTGLLLDYPPDITKSSLRPSTTPPATTTSTPSSAPSTTITTTASPTTAASTASSSTNTGAIVGGAVGGAAVLALLGFGAFFVLRKRRVEPDTPDQPVSTLSPAPAAGGIYPLSASPGTIGAASPHTSISAGGGAYADKTATVYSFVSNPGSPGAYPPGGGQWMFVPDAQPVAQQPVQGQHLSGHFGPPAQGNGGYQAYNPGVASGEFVPATAAVGQGYVQTVPVDGHAYPAANTTAVGSQAPEVVAVQQPQVQPHAQAQVRPSNPQYPSG